MRFRITKPVYGITLLSLMLLGACGRGGEMIANDTGANKEIVITVPVVATAPSLAAARMFHSATQLSDGKVLVAGGTSGTAYVAFAELYDPATNVWSAAGKLSKARAGHTSTLLLNGKVLITGGSDAAELYDPTTNSWSSAGNLITARSGHSATLLPSGKVLVTGGNGASSSILGGNKILSNAELYDPATNTWSGAASLASARMSHTATLMLTGNVLVTGGYGPGGGLLGSITSKLLASAEIYDPISNTWTLAASPAELRAYHTATLLPDGRVLVAGGFYEGSGVISFLKPHGSTELYDPVTKSWMGGGSLVTTRGYHTATLLPNGRVLVTGGLGDTGHIINGQHILDSAEFYDLSNNNWTAAGNLSKRREYHTATLLPEGKVLIVGGDDDRGVVANNEFF